MPERKALERAPTMAPPGVGVPMGVPPHAHMPGMPVPMSMAPVVAPGIYPALPPNGAMHQPPPHQMGGPPPLIQQPSMMMSPCNYSLLYPVHC
jgi:hypothetical protein